MHEEAGSWTSTTLGSLGEFRNGVNFNREQEGRGLPVLKVKDFGERVVAPIAGYDELSTSAITVRDGQILEQGDTVIIRSNGNSALVGRSLFVANPPARPLAFSGFCIRFRPDRGRIDPRFAAYLIRSPVFRARFSAFGSGTGIQNLSQGILGETPVHLPPLPSQRAIAHILGALDDKIELNRRTNETLEAIARALFKSWFVDFDPVRAKAAGRKPSGMDAETAALFPSAFVDSELGEIPKGWRTCAWGDLVKLEYGRALRGYQVASGPVPVFGTNGPIGFHTHALCSHPGIVVGRKGAYRGIHYSDRPFYVIDTAFYMDAREPISWRWAFHELLRFNLNGMDSGSAIPSTSREEFHRIPVCAPPHVIQRAFEDQLASCWGHQQSGRTESEVMGSIRDALLPRLLSGELTIPDAERIVGAAT